jgi:hypothetical protein
VPSKGNCISYSNSVLSAYPGLEDFEDKMEWLGLEDQENSGSWINSIIDQLVHIKEEIQQEVGREIQQEVGQQMQQKVGQEIQHEVGKEIQQEAGQ